MSHGVSGSLGSRRAGVFVFLVILLAAATPAFPGTGVSGVRIAVVGDYGTGGEEESRVAVLVSSWHPDIVVTAGDNNYPVGAGATLDANVGQFYHSFIGGYSGGYGEGSEENRFFPALGNHDWASGSLKPYRDYFDLPGNGRYYDVAIGPVRFFIVDSDPREPDGNSVDSKQARWLRTRLSETAEPWKIVVCHHPPYSSGRHGSAKWMQWPFQEWGATAVIAGHDHHYERIIRSGFPYFVDGLGGAHARRFRRAIPGSEVRFASDYGAMRITATAARIVFHFVDLSGKTVDRYAIERNGPPGRR